MRWGTCTLHAARCTLHVARCTLPHACTLRAAWLGRRRSPAGSGGRLAGAARARDQRGMYSRAVGESHFLHRLHTYTRPCVDGRYQRGVTARGEDMHYESRRHCSGLSLRCARLTMAPTCAHTHARTHARTRARACTHAPTKTNKQTNRQPHTHARARARRTHARTCSNAARAQLAHQRTARAFPGGGPFLLTKMRRAARSTNGPVPSRSASSAAAKRRKETSAAAARSTHSPCGSGTAASVPKQCVCVCECAQTLACAR